LAAKTSKRNTRESTSSGPRRFDTPKPDLDGKVILVTGGTGSFGKAFVRHVLSHHRPRKVIVFSRDEFRQYEMAQTPGTEPGPAIRYFIGDVRDCDRLEFAMRDVDYVIHAAALKHVPTAEYNPFECVQTNIHGAENVVKAAIRTGVARVVALSTDKAANPINLYGASKLASDKIFVAANSLAGRSPTRFSVVRYGNVIGSRGSVIPFFEKLIAERASSLPITDPRMTRFWITLSQGVRFVLSSLAMTSGGEIFVPRIPSMKVVDVASTIAPGLKHDIIGVRAGEKLHEMMIGEDDGRTTLALDDRYVIEPAFSYWTRESVAKYGGRPVENGFAYASDTNDEWLSPESLRELLKELRT
jgi:UDP-N-acetylglucosamine 4,6-dehydratase